MESAKTGVLYDPLTLLHCCERYHPERPERVESIIKHLSDKNLLNHPRVQFIQKLKQAPQQLIATVHKQKYINNVNKLLSEDNARSHVMVLDTYYNKHSKVASHLAVGGVIEGIDNIVSGRWKNAFAIVRPPGHHSGSRNTINGFCVYNNVAIGIEYLRRKHKFNRIAVFDWDVHHGDGTQHIFRQDKNLLFISLHRFDDGSFYPGESGSHLNVGSNAAEGMQINIPWDTTNDKYQSYELTPGDNEYIYIFERALYPILNQFKPEFIFISAGFDSARGDPLGGISVGPEGYRYMTRRLLKIAPLIVVLQGGYDLQSISWASQSVLCALIDEEGPRETSLNDHELKEKCWLPHQYHANIDRILPTFTKYWPLLELKKLIEYENAIKSNPKRVFGQKMTKQEKLNSSKNEQQIKQKQKKEQNVCLKEEISPKKEQQEKHHVQATVVTDPALEAKLLTIKERIPFSTQKGIEQFHPMYLNHKKSPTETGYYLAAGHVTNFRFDKEKVYKSVKDHKELEFYRSDFPEKMFAPKWLGFDEKCVILENLLYGMEEPNVVDIKVGKTDSNSKLSQAKVKKQQQKNRLSSTGQYGFRIVGLVTPQMKQYGLLFKDEDLIVKVLRKVVDKNNKKMILDFLNSLQETLRNCRRKYYSTSIIIIKSANKTQIRWIDFTYWHQCEEYDVNVVWGLENLVKFIARVDEE